MHKSELELESLEIGDVVFCTGDSSFCHSSNEEIVNKTKQYDTHNGEPYYVIWLSGNRAFDSRTGNAINAPLAYYIVPIEGKK